MTYAVELDVPLGFLIDPKEFAKQQNKLVKESLRENFDKTTKVLDVQATTVVTTPSLPW
ncbi:hypothetical protein [Streptomyces phage phiScoe15]|nr:hypothetical protein [Streptomyces phage phiScoe15]